MKRIAILFATCTLFAGIASAQQADTTSFEQLSEAVVKGVKVQKNAPYAVSNVERKTLENFSSTGKELPFLLSSTPGVLAWSENGVGTGTTYMRIRGAGDSRINVTLDGVPLNSPEDQCVFWANMNSYASLLGGVQIQRGVGSSTNGDGAFGGSIALQTKSISYVPYTEFKASYGSYNTFNTGVNFSSGLIRNHLVIDGAFNTTGTDGYIHGTNGNSGSWYTGVTWMGGNFMIRYKNIGNFEHTGQAWNGVTAGNDDLSLMDGTYGSSTGIHTYADLYKVGLGRYNSLYESLSFDADNYAFNMNADGSYVVNRHQMLDGSYWSRTTDNFTQDHNILSASLDINEYLKTSLSLHYTYGYGYYDEFRPNNKLKKFGLEDTWNAKGKTLTDFVRQKGLEQNTYGLVYNIDYSKDNLEIIGGASVQRFSGNHFGYLTYIKNQAVAEAINHADLNDVDMKNGRYQYYDSDAVKDDASTFIKAEWHLAPGWNLFADLQYRHVGYRTSGINDKFVKAEGGSSKTGPWVNQSLDIDKTYDFFNPKTGVSYTAGGHKVYASFAMSNREPERNNFTDNGNYPAPVAEHLNDYEAGYQYMSRLFQVSANLYFMDYRNQFVQTGAKSDIGEALTTNIAKSYRAGIELAAAVELTPWLRLEGNAALSRNVIKDFHEIVEDWDNWEGNDWNGGMNVKGEPFDGSETIEYVYENSTLAYSPSAILNGFLTFHRKDARLSIHTNYVSRQYLDNTANEDRSLPAYSTTGIDASYTFHFNRYVKELELGLNLGNIFDAHYASSGWVYSAIAGSYGHTNDNRYYQIGFIPMAGFTAMGSVRIRF